MIITNSRYALVGYFITSYPTRAHGIIVNYSSAISNIQTAVTNMTKQRIVMFVTKVFLQHALFCHVCNRSLYIILLGFVAQELLLVIAPPSLFQKIMVRPYLAKRPHR